MWAWQVCHGVGWDGGQKEQKRFGFWGTRAAGSLAPRQEVGKRMSWTLLCLFSASQLPLCASMPSVVCVSTEFSPSPLFSPCDCLPAASFPHLCASLLSVPSLCLSCLRLPSLCSFSAGFSLPLCPCCLLFVPLCPLSPRISSLLSLPLCPLRLPLCSPGLLSPSPVSLCLLLPGPCLILISSLITDLLEAGSSVGVLYLRELAAA